MTPAQLMALADEHARVYGDSETGGREQGDLSDLMSLARATAPRR